MIDHNTVFYTFSTMAQVLAAIIAVTTVFVFAKMNEYKGKMQREMSNVVWEFDILVAQSANPTGPATRQLDRWRKQATRSEHHGVIVEMKDIFKDHFERANFGETMRTACRNGLTNYDAYLRLIDKFAKLVYYGLALIGADLVFLAFTSEVAVDQYHTAAAVVLFALVAAAVAFLICICLFIRSTSLEK